MLPWGQILGVIDSHAIVPIRTDDCGGIHWRIVGKCIDLLIVDKNVEGEGPEVLAQTPGKHDPSSSKCERN